MEALFKLIRIGVGTEAPEPGTAEALTDVDWPALEALASEQGVSALAYDGLQKCYEANRGLVLPLDRVLKPVKYDWFGSVLNVEIKYEQMRKAGAELGDLFGSVGLRTLVLKGLSLALCYPVPQHRYSCDFDCFLMGSEQASVPVSDRSAYEKGNLLVEAEGVKVDRFHYKHSAFEYKGINVENHQFLTGWRGSRKWKGFEVELERMLEGEGALRPLEGTCLLVGPPMFNALFLTRHAHQHFLIEDGITLRHVCDWAMFLRRFRDDLDWDTFMSICRRYGLESFAGSMTRLAVYVCGIDAPVSGELMPEDRMLLKDILTVKGGGGSGRFGMALRILRSGWKFRYFSDETRVGCLLRYAWGVFFDKKPRL